MTIVKWSYMKGPQFMKASEFKARCLAVLDQVSETGRELTITKHGKPVARVVPLQEAPTLRGSVEYLVSDEELVAPLEAPWAAERD